MKSIWVIKDVGNLYCNWGIIFGHLLTMEDKTDFIVPGRFFLLQFYIHFFLSPPKRFSRRFSRAQYAATAVGNVRQELKELSQQLRVTQARRVWRSLESHNKTSESKVPYERSETKFLFSLGGGLSCWKYTWNLKHPGLNWMDDWLFNNHFQLVKIWFESSNWCRQAFFLKGWLSGSNEVIIGVPTNMWRW